MRKQTTSSKERNGGSSNNQVTRNGDKVCNFWEGEMNMYSNHGMYAESAHSERVSTEKKRERAKGGANHTENQQLNVCQRE